MRKTYAFILIAAMLAAVVVLAIWRPWLSSQEPAAEAPRSAISVRAVTAQRGSVQAWVFAEGTARSVQREYLTFENAGRIAWIAPGPGGGELREGDAVTAGMLLARQDQRRYNAAITAAQASVKEAGTQRAVAQSQLDQAKTDYELARTTFENVKALLGQGSATQAEYDRVEAQALNAAAAVGRAESQFNASEAQVESAQASLAQEQVDLEQTELRSPIDGVVAYLNIEAGYYFTPSSIRTDDETAALQTVPMVVLGTSQFEVTVSVPSFERGRIKPGQTVRIIAGAQTAEAMARGSDQGADQLTRVDDAIMGEVFAVNPAISPGGRSVQVKIRTSRNGERLEDGEFVTLWIATEQREDVVVAPMGVFTYRDSQPFVYVVNRATGVAELRPVVLGLQGIGTQQVLQGVEPGELLVTDGRFQLSDGAIVRVLDDPAASASTQAGGDDE